ncbi:hypothetical protein FHS29_004533 [Saccharothrix tamanrassetensis]|uniref:Uncharacterized protein n=1 Tax=Saccharothrix tamanrassetensis TaxID=1051531 RepID=A0A841CPK4_9PSEU|nr:hypothetical protein [Saccharothrix tamanrassetensis]MBB5957925.1 hypothetical protein [Saccharothrix tamanrassetensis]
MSTAQLVLIPFYRMIRLRDVDNDADVGGAEAIGAANRDGYASTGYELFVTCAQDLEPVTLTVTITTTPVEPAMFELECPSGHLVFGAPTGQHGDLLAPGGPGVYTGHLVSTPDECRITLWRTGDVEDDYWGEDDL